MYSANKKEVHTKDVPVHEKDQKVRPRYSEGPTILYLRGSSWGRQSSPFDDQGEHSRWHKRNRRLTSNGTVQRSIGMALMGRDKIWPDVEPATVTTKNKAIK